jgi:hypothetical protein
VRYPCDLRIISLLQPSAPLIGPIDSSPAVSQTNYIQQGYTKLPKMADSQTPQPPSGSEHLTPAPVTEDNIKPDPDLDASIEQDVDMNTENQPGANPDDTAAPSIDPMAPAPQPSKKETSLREFLGKMDDYAPIVSLSHEHPSLFLPKCDHTTTRSGRPISISCLASLI